MIKHNHELVKCGDCRFFVETQIKLGHGECRENSPGKDGWPVVTRTDCCGRGERLIAGVPEKLYRKAPVVEVKIIELPDSSKIISGSSSDINIDFSKLKNDIKDGIKNGTEGLASEATQTEGVVILKRVQELMEDAPEFEKPEDWK